MQGNWYEQYIGKPWVASPAPPVSFNCGELLRHVHKELGIETATIKADAISLRECVDNMRPEIFGLRALKEDESAQTFDCAFFARAKYEDHCGIAVETCDGLLILHCLQGVGVVLENAYEALARGFRDINWYRHKELS